MQILNPTLSIGVFPYFTLKYVLLMVNSDHMKLTIQLAYSSDGINTYYINLFQEFSFKHASMLGAYFQTFNLCGKGIDIFQRMNQITLLTIELVNKISFTTKKNKRK